ncbi:MAG: hypothetical protein QOD13_1284 [Thermoleophilaceae bacterium]|nr:hypothetical protein [Thermoleophilaceae bacterium]
MLGFRFKHRLGGGPPTVRSLPCPGGEAVARGDMVKYEGGFVSPGAAGDRLLGIALDSQEDSAAETAVLVITDPDAVYAVADGEPRSKDDTLALAGASGAQGVAPHPASEFTVIADSPADGDTLLRISGSHHRTIEDDTGLLRLTGGDLNAALARSVVRYYRAEMGRGPAHARAFYRDELVVVVLEDALTKPEQALKAVGRADAVIDLRQALQTALRDEFVAIVEGLTGAKVKAFMSSNHLDPDMLVELFVLDRVPGASTPARA